MTGNSNFQVKCSPIKYQVANTAARIFIMVDSKLTRDLSFAPYLRRRTVPRRRRHPPARRTLREEKVLGRTER
jgi:hypothetical protein